MSFTQALEFARGPGIAVIAGWIISFALEYSAGFQTISAKARVLVYILLCLVVPLAATALSVATGIFGAWPDVATTWWPAIAAGIFAAGLGTLFHAYVPENTKAKTTNAV